MFVETSGHGPALVLLHGFGLHSGFLEPLALALTDQFTVHRVDLPGHGRSVDEPFAVDAIIGELHERFAGAHVVGWSLGGLLAQLLPDAASLSLIASSARFLRHRDWPHGVDPATLSQFGADLRSDFAGTMRRFVALEVLGGEHTQLLPEALARATQFGPPSLQALESGLDFLHRFDRREPLSAPPLWIGGSRDRMIRPQAIRASAALSTCSRALLLAGAGHAPFMTHPQQLAQAIAEHAHEA